MHKPMEVLDTSHFDTQAQAGDQPMLDAGPVLDGPNDPGGGARLETASSATALEKLHFDAFVIQANRYDLLTPEQEIALGRQVQAGLQAAERLQTGAHESAAARVEDEALAGQGDEARLKFVHANLRLVAWEAIRFRNTDPRAKRYGLMDIVQEGSLGLNRAVEKFDPESGNRFVTYAVTWIRGTIQNAFKDKGNTVRLPRDVYDLVGTVGKLQEAGHSDDEIMKIKQIDRSKLVALKELLVFSNDGLVSLDAPINVEDDPDPGTHREIIVDPATLGGLDPEMVMNEPAGEPEESWKDNPLLMALKPFLNDKDVTILERVANGETLEDQDARYLRNLRTLFEHPAIRARIRDFDPTGDAAAPDWRDEAGCRDYPDTFTVSGASKESIASICAGCAVRDQCEAYLMDNKPLRGRWIDGLTTNALRKRAQVARTRTAAS